MRNVVLIVLDTVRKDTFDEYATRLQAASGTSFEQARAASSWSVPSHTSIFTGQLPHQHGVHAESFDSTFSFATIDKSETFLGELPEYRAIGMSANSYMNQTFGFDALFDEYTDFSIGSHIHENLFTDGLGIREYLATTDEPIAAKRYLGFLRTCLAHDRPLKSIANGVWSQIGTTVKRLPIPELVDDGARNIARTARDRTTGGEGEPFFLFANAMDAHTPLRNLRQFDQSLHSVPNDWSSNELDKWELNKDGLATEEYTRNYRQLYAAAVEYLDRVIIDLIDDVQRATARETTFVIISDHGHNLGYDADDGLFHHTGSMTEGIMHTPCEVINPPAGYPETVSEYFSHLELGELIVRLAHEEPFDDDLTAAWVPAETIGLLGTDPTWGREFTDDEYAHWNRMIRCAYHGHTKVEWTSLGTWREYELDPDRPSWQQLIADDPTPVEEATALFEEGLMAYKRRAAADEQDLAFDDRVATQLRELGYL